MNNGRVANTTNLPQPSLYVRNDVQRSWEGTRRTVRLTTTTGPVSAGQQRFSSVPDCMACEILSCTFISVSSTLNRMTPKRHLLIVLMTSTTAALSLTSFAHARQPSLMII